ncbi:MAG: hypothetical protein IT531_11060 [Burkholderiales bacterium]|nr:hypothetical protein [Burkholderiales bacterium]
MLNWFTTARVDHPLADAKQSRRVIEDLPKEANKALAEVLFWLDSVHATEGFRVDRRLQLYDELEQAAKPHVRKLGQDYLQLRQQKFQEHRVWSALSEHWRLIATGYVQCIEGFQADAPGAGTIRARLPQVVGRALLALGMQLKWLLLRYGPIDGALWADIGRVYAFAEVKGFADSNVRLYDDAVASSPRKALARILMLAVASAESLLPDQIELAERTVALFGGRYVLDHAASAASTHAFDLAMRKPPARLAGKSIEGGVSVRYLGAGTAYDELNRLLGILLAEGALPSEVNLGAAYEPAAIEAVWRHLLQYWAIQPTERGSARHAANVRLTVVPGFQGLTRALSALPGDSLDFSADTDAALESWVAEDASDAGYGARVPASRSDWVRVGALVGVKVEGEKHWGAGVVRRMLRDGEQNRHVGIRLLGRVVVAVRLAPTGTTSAFNAVRDNDPGILLTPRPDADRGVSLMLAPGCYSRGQAVEMRVHGQAFLLEPVKLLESNDEFDSARFVLVRRIA